MQIFFNLYLYLLIFFLNKEIIQRDRYEVLDIKLN